MKPGLTSNTFQKWISNQHAGFIPKPPQREGFSCNTACKRECPYLVTSSCTAGDHTTGLAGTAGNSGKPSRARLCVQGGRCHQEESVTQWRRHTSYTIYVIWHQLHIHRSYIPLDESWCNISPPDECGNPPWWRADSQSLCSVEGSTLRAGSHCYLWKIWKCQQLDLNSSHP